MAKEEMDRRVDAASSEVEWGALEQTPDSNAMATVGDLDDHGGDNEAEDGEPSFKIVHPMPWPNRLKRIRRRSRERKEDGLELKVLPLLGAILGLTSFTLAWDGLPKVSKEGLHRLGDYILSSPFTYDYYYEPSLAIAAALILLGSILLFASSFGGILQMSGICLFVVGMPGDVSQLHIGFVVCLSGAILGCSSFVIREPVLVPMRYLTFGARQTPGGRHTVALTSLACFTLGIVSACLPWFVYEYTWRFGDYFHMPDLVYHESLLWFAFEQSEEMLVMVGILLFLIGTFVVLLTPLGSLGQGVGLVAFFFGMQPELLDGGSYYGGYDTASHFGAGFFLGFVAAAIGILALFYPLRRELSLNLLPPPAEKSATSAVERLSSAASGFPSTARGVLARMLPFVVVLLIFLASAVSIAALAYTQKWSKVEIWIESYLEQGELIDITVMVDDSIIHSGIVFPYSQLIAETHTAAGTHKLSIDYCILSVDEEGTDGEVDWSTWFTVRPFSTTRVPAHIGLYYSMYYSYVKSVELESESVENGSRVTLGTIEGVGFFPVSSISWAKVMLMLTDGDAFVHWNPSWEDLRDDPGDSMTYGNRTLGDTNVSLEITDLYGDGSASTGDFITLNAMDGTSFSPDTTYTLLMLDDDGFRLVGECELVFS